MIVEQKGRDVWRGRYRTLEHAIENDAAGVGVDRILLTRSKQYDVKVIIVVVEEMKKIFVAPISKLFDPDFSRSRADYRGRGMKLMDLKDWDVRYLGPNLHSNKRIAKA